MEETYAFAIDASGIEQKIGQALSILECLPESVRDSLLERFSDFRDLSIEFGPGERSPASGADCHGTIRFVAICPMLDELIVAAVSAAEIGGA